MKFRKIYWVTEQLGHNGESKVIGVYTSIYDLRTLGIRWDEEVPLNSGFRLSLVKLDGKNGPLGCWTSPDFQEIAQDLQAYIASGEMIESEVEQLIADLKAHTA